MNMLNSRRGRLGVKVACLTLAASAGLTACNNADTSAGSSSSKEISIHWSSSALDENQRALEQTMKDIIPSLEKSEDITIKLTVSDAQMTLDKQISDIQSAMVKKPDVMIVDPVDASGLTGVVADARAQGIKMVDMRPGPDDDPKVWDASWTGNAEADLTKNTQGYVQGLLDADPSLVLNVGLLYGAAAQAAQRLRCDVIKEMAKEQPDRIKVVAEKVADWNLQQAQDATTDFLTAHPEMNLIVAAGDAMGYGAANALKAAGKTDSVRVATYDVNADNVKAVEDGVFSFTTGLDQRAQGRAYILGATEVAMGTFSGDLLFKPVYAVSPETSADVTAALTAPLPDAS